MDRRRGSKPTAMFLVALALLAGACEKAKPGKTRSARVAGSRHVTEDVQTFLTRATDLEFEDILDTKAVEEAARRRAGLSLGATLDAWEFIESQRPRWIMHYPRLKGMRVRRIQRKGTDRAVAVVDVWTCKGDRWRYRLELAWTTFRWRVSDFGALTNGMSAVETVAGLLRAAAAERDGVVRAIVVLGELLHAYPGLDKSEQMLSAMANQSLPRRFNAQRHAIAALIRFGKGNSAAALVAADRALALDPGLPLALLAKASILLDLQRPAEVLPVVAAHRARFGDGADAREVEVEALLALNRPEEALNACRAGLADENMPWLIAQLAMLLGPDKKDTILPHLEKLDPSSGAFRELGELLADYEEWDALEMACLHLRKKVPNHPRVAYYEALAKLYTTRPEEAEKTAFLAITDASGTDRRALVGLYIDATYREGHGLAGYAKLADRDRAHGFAYAAQALYAADEYVQLRELVNKRRTETRNLDLVLLWETELLWHAGGKDAEVVAFVRKHADQLKRVKDEARWIPGDRLIRSLVRLNKLDEAEWEARRFYGTHKDPYLIILVCASAGKTGDAIHGFHKALAGGYAPADLYNDIDVGPLLRRPAYKDLHKKYPPPPIEDDGKK